MTGHPVSLIYASDIDVDDVHEVYRLLLTEVLVYVAKTELLA